jgi:hypothetical protein
VNIRKIAGRTIHPPRFHPVLNAAHLGRFAGWALLGAATLQADPLTGLMLVVSRTPAVGLVLVTFLQRQTLRPSPGRLAAWLLPTLGPLVAACAALALVRPPPLLVGALQGFVAVCFAVLAGYGLPAQIAQAVRQPLGNLRWFQLALLVNYGWMLVYAFWVRQEGVQLLMRAAYAVVFVEQAMLVVLIERGIRARRARH